MANIVQRAGSKLSAGVKDSASYAYHKADILLADASLTPPSK